MALSIQERLKDLRAIKKLSVKEYEDPFKGSRSYECPFKGSDESRALGLEQNKPPV